MTQMMCKSFPKILTLVSVVLLSSLSAFAQSGSTRPRRVNQTTQTETSATTTSTSNTTTADTTTNTTSDNTASRANSANRSVAVASADTAHAFALLQQKQYAAAAREAKQIAANNPNDAEAWKIAGFAELNMNQYTEAAADLQRALDLQRAANQEDPNTVNALAVAYMRTEKFDLALPLLVSITTRTGVAPDPAMLNYRGFAELRTGKTEEAERTFNQTVKADPKNATALYYLGKIAYDKGRLDAAINALNRATVNDARLSGAWFLLATAYLQRADTATDSTKANADYLSAARAAESLTRVKADAASTTLHGRALIGAKEFTRAALVLERAANADSTGATLYWLGVAYSRAKNFPKATNALERAAAKSPDDVNIYRELGYVYEISRQYAKALTAYQRGATLAPDDTDFKDAIMRVEPLAK